MPRRRQPAGQDNGGQFAADTSGATNIPAPSHDSLLPGTREQYEVYREEHPTVSYNQFKKIVTDLSFDQARADIILTSEEEWNDSDDDVYDMDSEGYDDDFPLHHVAYGTHRYHSVSGELADRVRRAFGVTDPNAEVLFKEDETTAGDLTEITTFSHTVECLDREKGTLEMRFDGWESENGLVQLLNWLDKEAPRQ